MSQSHNPAVVTDCLVFYWDMSNTKSWKGGPITNYAAYANARIDPYYVPSTYDPGGTFLAHHSDQLQVYNCVDGGAFSSSAYTNGGVSDYTNTYHAIWTYDEELGKAVTTMRDFDGIWKAKTFGSIPILSSLGLGVGSKYTISWLQWVDNLAKAANSGLYQQTTAGAFGFYDGQGATGTSLNTKLRTWQRVYHTYTISATQDITKTNAGVYMYGMSNVNGCTLKIADVQWEPYSGPSPYCHGLTRSSTQSSVDLSVNKNVITTNAIVDNADGSCSFNGSNLSIANSSSLQVGETFSVAMWVYPTSMAARQSIFSTRIANPAGCWQLEIGTGSGGTNRVAVTGVGTWMWESADNQIPLNQWSHICFTKPNNASVGAMYVNGKQLTPVTTTAYTVVDNADAKLVGGSMVGKIGLCQLYSKALAAAEVGQNFSAHRGRYGV